MASAVATKPKSAAVKAAVITDKLIGSLGGTIDHAYELRERKRMAEAVVKGIDEEIAANNEMLMARLDSEETTKGAGRKASASITTAVVGTLTDPDAFWAYVAKKKYFHLVQKRLSDPALREIWDKNLEIPGVEKFHKRTLNIRVIPPSA